MATVLFVGGTGEISKACVEEAVRCGHDVTVFTRGKRGVRDKSIQHIQGDLANVDCYAAMGDQEFDVVCQFLGFTVPDVERDIEFFTNRCGQYIFISSASAYQKPWSGGSITEDTPLENPFMQYSRDKAACEAALLRSDAGLNVTIVRPSHTYRERLPSTVIDGNHMLWRVLNSKPVVIHDDGESLWALTRAEDFATAFVALFGKSEANGEAYHITDPNSHSWNSIYQVTAELLGIDMEICRVTTQRLVAAHTAWEGPLRGDKANSVIFDNTKIQHLCSGWQPAFSLAEGMKLALESALERQKSGYTPPQEIDLLLDQIIGAR